MANTIITGASTSSVSLNSNEVLAVTSTGSLFVPGGVINGSAETGQSVTIAGYVEVVYLWLAGANNVSISQSGIFRGHGGGTDIYLGVDTLGNVTGGSILNNAGMIVADANNITMFGDNNLVQNSGTIDSRFLSVSFEAGENSQLINSGSITSRDSSAVNLSQDGASVANSGTISAHGFSALAGIASNLSLTNEGTMTSASLGSNATVSFTGSGSSVRNDGLIDSAHGQAVIMDGTGGHLINHGTIRADDEAVSLLNFAGTVRNSGEITSASGIAITLTPFATATVNHLFNSGSISGVETAIVGSGGIESIVNRGEINGDISLGGNNDIFDGRNGTVVGIVDGGDGNDLITGGISDDTLRGGTGNDILRGKAGSDILQGGDGRDQLSGGADDDTFVFTSINDAGKGANGDVILDFNRGVDTIDLSAIDADTGVAGNQAFTFVTGAFTGAGQIHFIAGTHILEGNVNANLAADFQITLDKISTLSAVDFVL